MKSPLSPALAQQIRHLLQKSHTPKVRVSQSTIHPEAGKGVVSTSTVSPSHDVPVALCLYPGVYTPGLPSHVRMAADASADPVYLAGVRPPSFYSGHSVGGGKAGSNVESKNNGESDDKYEDKNWGQSVEGGLEMEDNAYVMNLQDCGGYIDGCALVDRHGARLEVNPSACGHLVNHDSAVSNTAVVSFHWSHVFAGIDAVPQNGVAVQDGDASMEKSMLQLEESNMEESDEFHSPPNELRMDGSPWYFDGVEQRIVNFPTMMGDSKSNSMANHSEEGAHDAPRQFLCGAALIVTKPIAKGEELLLDYKLRAPYPRWAMEWYK